MRTLNIYVPEPWKEVGGPTTFLKNFHEASAILGYKFSRKRNNIFFPIFFDLNVLNSIKKKNGHIIQRLDGIYYPSKHGPAYIEHNALIKEAYLNYTTHFIFQSNYSIKQCFEMFGEKKNYSLIYNGANKKIFFPSDAYASRDKTVFITTGNFRNIDMLEPVIRALDILAADYMFELQILGPIKHESMKSLIDRPYCRYLGESTDQRKIASCLQHSDAFIYSHLNPPCPNSVVEAISCGLPVIGFNSGAMSELCFFNKELLAHVSDMTFQEYRDFDVNGLVNVIRLYFKSPDFFKRRALEFSNLYCLEECVQKYLDVFAKLGIEDESEGIIDRLKNFLETLKS